MLMDTAFQHLSNTRLGGSLTRLGGQTRSGEDFTDVFSV